MIQKRRVRNLNWLTKNCKFDSCDNCNYIEKESDSQISKYYMTKRMWQEFANKEVFFNTSSEHIVNAELTRNILPSYFEEWMFEPLKEKK